MKKNKRTPIAAMIVLALALVTAVVSGTQLVSTRAALNPSTATYDGEIEVSTLDVQLYENGKASTGALLSDLKQMEPGKKYEEKVSAYNGADASEYVRMIVRKYWTDADGKNIALDPEFIELRYDSKEYNDSDWAINPKESTEERSVYYLKKSLAGNKESAVLFNSIRVNEEIAKDYTTSEKDNIITLTYKYDGATVNIEVEVQSVQEAHGDKAVPSAWGVSNVKANEGSLEVSE